MVEITPRELNEFIIANTRWIIKSKNYTTSRFVKVVKSKTGPNEFKRHTLVLSDNVTAFAEQIDSNTASTDRYRVTFKPSSLIRDVDLR